MKAIIKITIISLAILFSGCSMKKNSFTYKSDGPLGVEGLVSRSLEQISFSSASPSAVKEIRDWIKKDTPQKAEIFCTKTNSKFHEIIKILVEYQIPYEIKENNDSSNDVILYYSEVTNLDCSDLLDDKNAFGCARSTNMLNMVGKESL
jgi:hypothetical protein